MYLYNFDIVNKKIIAYDRNNFNATIVDLQQPLLSFVNCNFSEYDALRRKIFQFIQSSPSFIIFSIIPSAIAGSDE